MYRIHDDTLGLICGVYVGRNSVAEETQVDFRPISIRPILRYFDGCALDASVILAATLRPCGEMVTVLCEGRVVLGVDLAKGREGAHCQKPAGRTHDEKND